MSRICHDSKRKRKRPDSVVRHKPVHPQTNPKGNMTTQKRHQKHYTTIADRLRAASLSNDSHPTGVMKPVYAILTFTLTATAMLSKGHTLKIINNPPYTE